VVTARRWAPLGEVNQERAQVTDSEAGIGHNVV
jgi:hypothetical protein